MFIRRVKIIGGIYTITDKTLANLIVLVYLNLKRNAIAKDLLAAAKTSEIKVTISDIFLKVTVKDNKSKS